MTKSKVIVLIVALFSCLSAIASAATPPKVVFIGDTGGWAPIFAAHPNWINKGTDPWNDPGGGYFGASDSISGSVLARFQTDVVAQHPAVVHIMAGWSDAYRDRDAIDELWLDQYIYAMTTMVKMAKAANIKVILATEPESGNPMRQANAWVEGYGAANGIQVINYAHLLLDYGGLFATLQGDDSGGYQDLFIATPVSQINGPGVPAGTITDAGYQQIGLIAESAIETVSLTLKSGYLASRSTSYNTVSINVNSFGPSQTARFIPYGKYSDGVVRPITNTNFDGASGTWFSSNPAVMYVDQQGRATALATGTARIWFTALNGAIVSPFDVTVGSICGPTSIYCPTP